MKIILEDEGKISGITINQSGTEATVENVFSFVCKILGTVHVDKTVVVEIDGEKFKISAWDGKC